MIIFKFCLDNKMDKLLEDPQGYHAEILGQLKKAIALFISRKREGNFSKIDLLS